MTQNELPSVPQYLREKEAARGCRPNVYALNSRRLDPHETAMAECGDRPTPLLSLENPILVGSVGAVALIAAGFAFGRLVMGWW